MTEIQKHRADEMTPVERKKAIEEGKSYDRVPCVPFMGELKGVLSGISVWDLSHDPEKMAEAEIIPFNRYGYDRMDIGPNSRGITEALGGKVIYPEKGVPYMDAPLIQDYVRLESIEPVDARTNARIGDFARTAQILADKALRIVPVEMSIGGPLTIASNLRGVERLLRDLRKCPDDALRLIRLVADSERSCIDLAAQYGMGIAMADPVANPALIGPKMYERFVYPFTKELTDYAYEKTGKKVSLHMCGQTEQIWDYFKKYELNEVSLDNIVDLEKAAQELGPYIPIAGNVDPVEIILNVERFRWQIYRPYSGMQWNGLIGQDPGYVAAELQRRIQDALRMDDRVQGISDFSYTVSGDVLTASLTVNTVYGEVESGVEVTLT